jgi:hypothetical protein
LERGIIAPTSTKEQLVVMAKQDYGKLQSSAASATDAAASSASSVANSVYSAASVVESAVRDYSNSAVKQVYSLTDLYYPVASSVSSYVSGASSQASKSASSLSKSASSAASSVSKNVPTDASSLSYEVSSGASGASKSASSLYAAASGQAVKAANDATDYVYSSWDDSQLRSWLIDNGYMKSKTEATRDQMLGYAKDAYTSTVNAPYEVFSDSYLVSSAEKDQNPYRHSHTKIMPAFSSTTGLSTKESSNLPAKRPEMNT